MTTDHRTEGSPAGRPLALGIDYGTSSVRAMIVDVRTGEEVAEATWTYAHGVEGVITDDRDPHVARQHPADYIEGFERTVRAVLQAARSDRAFSPSHIVGIGVDTTGSTPMPVDASGMPLGMLPTFADNPAAMAWLWKDHTSHAEAAELTAKASAQGLPYLAKCGGTYSSEWYWSKVLRCHRKHPEVAAATHCWVELCDFVPAFITGTLNPAALQRSICAAGHKAMYHESWGGLPSAAFLDSVQPGLSKYRANYGNRPVTSDTRAGLLTREMAVRTGLPAGIPVAVGAFDAHLGAVGSGIGAGTLVKIMGTSTCDCMVAPLEQDLPDIPGVCGIVPGSVLPGMHGIEAGQSAVGDIFNWFVQHMVLAGEAGAAEVHARLTAQAANLLPGESGLVALDWHNGNRTVLVDPLLTGLIVGQTLHTSQAEVYRALIEATAFGALKIIERIEQYGVGIDRIVNCGGIAEKNPLVMQIYADICNRPMYISRSGQTCALGAAILGAVVGAAHRSVPDAQRAMTGVKETVYTPDPARAAVYRELYDVYTTLHDAFGSRGATGPSVAGVMKELIAIRTRARSAR